MTKGLLKTLCCIGSMVVVFAFCSMAQDQWSWPEKPKNLQVLNEDCCEEMNIGNPSTRSCEGAPSGDAG